MDTLPTKIEFTGEDRIVIQWSDGVKREYSFGELRAACPCATCRQPSPAAEESNKPAAATGAGEHPAVTVSGMTPAGNYAYRVEFSDGHRTGIFSLQLLRTLGREVT